MSKRVIDLSKVHVLPDLVVEILRRSTPAERIAAGQELNKNTRNRMAAFIVSEHPDWEESQVRAEIARRWFAGEVDENA